MQTNKLFYGKKVRAIWDDTNKKWWLSVVDICAVMCDCPYDCARNYWKQMKFRLMKKHSRLMKNTHQVKLRAKDGKLRNTDVMDYKKVIQLIQAMSCDKVDRIKAWLGSIAAKHCDLASLLDIERFVPETNTAEFLHIRRKLFLFKR